MLFWIVFTINQLLAPNLPIVGHIVLFFLVPNKHLDPLVNLHITVQDHAVSCRKLQLRVFSWLAEAKLALSKHQHVLLVFRSCVFLLIGTVQPFLDDSISFRQVEVLALIVKGRWER